MRSLLAISRRTFASSFGSHLRTNSTIKDLTLTSSLSIKNVISDEHFPSSKMMDIISGKPVAEAQFDSMNRYSGVKLGLSCTPCSSLTGSTVNPQDWNKNILFSKDIQSMIADDFANGNVSNSAPDVMIIVTNPINGISYPHIGRIDCAAETTDLPMLYNDVLLPVYGGSGAKTCLGGLIQSGYACYLQIAITGIKNECGWHVSDELLNRFKDVDATHNISPCMIVPVTTPGNEVLLGLPFLNQYGISLDCSTKIIDISPEPWVPPKRAISPTITSFTVKG